MRSAAQLLLKASWDTAWLYILIFKKVTSTYLFKFWLCWIFLEAHRFSYPETCRILVLWPGIEPASPALEGEFLTTGPPRRSPGCASWANSGPHHWGSLNLSEHTCVHYIKWTVTSSLSLEFWLDMQLMQFCWCRSKQRGFSWGRRTWDEHWGRTSAQWEVLSAGTSYGREAWNFLLGAFKNRSNPQPSGAKHGELMRPLVSALLSLLRKLQICYVNWSLNSISQGSLSLTTFSLANRWR